MVSLEYRRRVDKRVADIISSTVRAAAGRRALAECIGASKVIGVVAGPGVTENPEVAEAEEDDKVHEADGEINAHGATAGAEMVEDTTEV